ncbi:cystinosin [Plakobranchus ocellatus]|uniref:Cystinosin n=1 Tax=Plakobranchus ocellatus TaxID=259542 RepID=A0AAV4AW96_9GAST|nr:cystinosin [Plakobranchus ocellatus]
MDVAVNETVRNITRDREAVVHSDVLTVVSAIIGWSYFTAWTLSFYPQVLYNWRRKSVLGLSFDFVAFNFTGFVAYSCFNLSLYFIPEVKAEYYKHHPEGVAPVELNDVVFSVHALAITSFTVVQCFIYEKGTQKINTWARVLLTIVWTYVLVTVIMAMVGTIEWLDFLYGFSYLKVGVTVLKYIPQAYLNYVRKSTMGWSIGNVLLDLTGGILSILQMLLNAYNGDDWDSLFGNLTKLVLGIITIIFDMIFIIQHYCLYRHAPEYTQLQDIDINIPSQGHRSRDEEGRVRQRPVSPTRTLYSGINTKYSSTSRDSQSTM